MSGRFFVAFLVVLCAECLNGANVGGWQPIKTIPASYFSISTQNVLRCGKLCERQGKCTYVTFDGLKRVCYMHANLQTTVQTLSGTDGRYLFKGYSGKTELHGSTCDKDTQIALPSVPGNFERCHDMKAAALLEQNCITSEDCVVPASECRSEGLCGCQAGYSYRSRTQSCELECSQYGSTFQVFNGYLLAGFNDVTISDKTVTECQQLCINSTAFVCISFELNDSNMCFLQSQDALDQPASYTTSTSYVYYQRNCA